MNSWNFVDYHQYPVFMYTSYNGRLDAAVRNQAVYKQLGLDLMDASDFLTEQARNYVQYGEKTYYDAYINEVNNVTEAARLSGTLERIEREAFAAVGKGDFDKARSLMFGDRYKAGKQPIINAMNRFQLTMNRRAEREADAAREAASLALVVTGVLVTVSVLSAILSLFIILNYARRDGALREEREEQQRALAEELRQAALAAQAALDTKTVFLANMSREFKSPVNGIINYTELGLRTETSPEAGGEYLQKIKTSAEGLLRIINDVLDISRIETGELDLKAVPFDLNDVFRDCREAIVPSASGKGLILQCYVEPTGRKLPGDPERLRQVLTGLLSNAVKFTDAGKIKLLSETVVVQEKNFKIDFGDFPASAKFSLAKPGQICYYTLAVKGV